MGSVVGWLERPVKFGVLVVVGLALIAAAFAAGLGMSGAFATHDDPDELHACVNGYTGVMRYVQDPAQCTPIESPVSWNGGNGLGSTEFVSLDIPVPADTNLSVLFNCLGRPLLDAGYSSNPSVKVDEAAFGPTSATTWSALLRPAQNTTITITGHCAVPDGGGAPPLSQAPQITFEVIED